MEIPKKDILSPDDYSALSPDLILDAIDSCGYKTDGSALALNSYENRVLRIGLDNDVPLIAKFYRPLRWSNEAIIEEHQFCLELNKNEIPVVAPLVDENGQTLHEYQGYRFSLFPMQGGRWPDLENLDDYERMGRFMARIHGIGASHQFQSRQQINIDNYGYQSANYLLEKQFIPAHIETAYKTLTDDLLVMVKTLYELAGDSKIIRLHGDCHRGNILWTDNGPHFVDFDDACSGPAVQDLWMLLAGERAEVTTQLSALLDGYNCFTEFDLRELHLIEALRTLRMMHYAAWLAKRWDDPAFPVAFPWFNTVNYWEQHIQELREQLYVMQEPVIQISAA
ncbi:MAG: serine/threonine protein kinase [Pseudomonadota bacterium]